MTWRILGFGLLWIALIVYAFGFAPPDQPDTFTLIQNLSTGKWQGINPWVISLFNLMGIWPLVYGCVLFADGRGQQIRAWPFVIGSFGVGAFAILPYLALRHPNPRFSGPKNTFLRLWDSQLTAILLMLGAIALLVYGLTRGNWPDFVQQWQTSRFIHVMGLDFCLLSILFSTLLGDDMARRGMDHPTLFWIVVFLPLIGPLVYLLVRSPLVAVEVEPLPSQSSV